MAKSVTVMLRIKAGRTYPLIRVVFSKNGKPKIDPRATSFYLRYTLDGKRKCDAVGSDLDAVLARKIEIESKLRTGAPVGINPTLVAPNLTTITGAANQYFENLAARGLDIKTTHTYRVAVCDFVKSCSKTFVEDIDKQDLFNYMAWLRKQAPAPRKDGTPRKRRKSGDPERTYFNKVGHVAIFLKAYGKSGLLKKSEYPQFKEKPVNWYDEDQIPELYSHCENSDETFLLDFVFQTMMRADELAYIEYADIRDGILNIQNKTNWHPKRHHQRRIRLDKDLLARIAARRKTATSTYIFPNRVGGPNKHLLRVIERIAKRAGITDDATLHRARRTSITLYSGETNPQTIQKLAGHKDLRTTMRYLVAYEANSKQMQEATESVSKKLKSARTTAASDAA